MPKSNQVTVPIPLVVLILVGLYLYAQMGVFWALWPFLLIPVVWWAFYARTDCRVQIRKNRRCRSITRGHLRACSVPEHRRIKLRTIMARFGLPWVGDAFTPTWQDRPPPGGQDARSTSSRPSTPEPAASYSPSPMDLASFAVGILGLGVSCLGLVISLRTL